MAMARDMDMDMSDHMGMSCSMNSALTWSYKGTCIITSSWVLKSKLSLFVTCLLIMIFTIVIQWIHFKVTVLTKSQANLPLRDVSRRQNMKLIRLCLYSLESFCSLIVMLLFMTYVGWIWIAIMAGSMIGWYVYDTANIVSDLADRDPLICH